MKLMELYATLALDSSNFEKGVKGASSLGKSLASSISVNLSNISAKTIAMGNAMYDAGKQVLQLGASAVKSVITEYSETEQLIGGIETLFKDSAKTVIDSSSRAFKSAGMDANTYMETVTSFSASLLQGLEGDTVRAASVADMAITDMSDNANKMGTSMTLIQNAYQGFAKDNFTMLDNLKLGYGGTAEEMARLINDSGVLGKTLVNARNVSAVPLDKMFEAIHIIQTEMGITGTTAKEAASTISGSFNAFNAAWKNLLSGMASDQDVDKLMDDLFETGEIMVSNVLNLLPRIGKNVISGVDSLLEKWDFYSLLKNAYNVGGWDAVWDAATATVKRKLGEWSAAALDTGADFTANLISGITGEEVNSEDVKDYYSQALSGIGDVLNGLKETAGAVFDWITQNGDIVLAIVSPLAMEFGALKIAADPLGTILTAAASGLILFTTDWEEFEKTSPQLVETFEALTGMEFSSFINGIDSVKNVLNGISTWYDENPGIVAFLLTIAGGVSFATGHPAAGVSSLGAAVVLAEQESERFEQEVGPLEEYASSQSQTIQPTILGIPYGEELPTGEAIEGFFASAPTYSEEEIENALEEIRRNNSAPPAQPTILGIPYGEELPEVEVPVSFVGPDGEEIQIWDPLNWEIPGGEEDSNISGTLERIGVILTALSAGIESMPEMVASAFSGIGITMDGVTVGNLVLPTVSAGLARQSRSAVKTSG